MPPQAGYQTLFRRMSIGRRCTRLKRFQLRGHFVVLRGHGHGRKLVLAVSDWV